MSLIRTIIKRLSFSQRGQANSKRASYNSKSAIKTLRECHTNSKSVIKTLRECITKVKESRTNNKSVPYKQ